MQVDGQCECGLEGDMAKRRKEGRSTCRWMDNVNVDLREIWRRGKEGRSTCMMDGQCECGLEGDMEKRRKEGRSTCRWMDNVNVDLREIWRRGERKEDRRAGGWTM